MPPRKKTERPDSVPPEVWERAKRTTELADSLIKHLAGLHEDPADGVIALSIAIARLCSVFELDLEQAFKAITQAYQQHEDALKRPQRGH